MANRVPENDPEIEKVLCEAAADNADISAVGKRLLHLHLNHAGRLAWLVNEKQVAGAKFAALAKEICGRSKAFRLLKLAPFRGEIERWIESEEEAAIAKNKPFECPSWNQCYRRYVDDSKPAKDDDEEEAEEPKEDDGGLAGHPPEANETSLQSVVDMMAEQLHEAATQRSAAEQRVKELEEEVKRLKEQNALLLRFANPPQPEEPGPQPEEPAKRGPGRPRTKPPSDDTPQTVRNLLESIRDRPGAGWTIYHYKTREYAIEHGLVEISDEADVAPVITAKGKLLLEQWSSEQSPGTKAGQS